MFSDTLACKHLGDMQVYHFHLAITGGIVSHETSSFIIATALERRRE